MVGDSFGEEIVLELEEEYLYTIVAKTAMKMYHVSHDFQYQYQGSLALHYVIQGGLENDKCAECIESML